MRYNDLNGYLRGVFGCKVYKLSLVGCTTCPNRDGTVGSRGCIFCSKSGSGEFAAAADKSVESQIETAKKRVSKKLKGAKEVKYIAYFQSFTNTYAPVSRLKKLFYGAIENPDVAVLSVATRPDCLPDEVITLLAELNKIKPVWVELGLQTVHEATAKYIRRGYPLCVYDDAVKRLHSAGISVIAHMIIGLPGETEEMIYETAYHIGQTADGIKLHMLYVQDGTDLAAEYREGKFTLPGMNECIRLLAGCVERLPESTVVHRLTGDGDKRTLIAPEWTADKRRVLNAISREFERLDVVQGRLV